jgi:chromosome segregation ATPase
MRDGLPEAKSCRAELASYQTHLAAVMKQRADAERDANEANKRLADLDRRALELSEQIASLADGIISNLEYEIKEQLPSMWKQPVKIEVAA